MNEKTMFKLTYGLFVLTARQGEKDNGCIINTAGQVTAVPNRISIAVNKANYTHDMVLATKKFNVSILSEDAKFSTFQRFGFQSGKDVNKFEGYDQVKRAENGIYYVTEGTNGYISATVESTMDLGSHTLFIAAVDDMDVLSDVPSTTYNYYQSNIKPNLPHRPVRPERQSGAAGSADMNMREKSFRLTLSARSASIPLPTLRRLLCKNNTCLRIVSDSAEVFQF